MNTLVRLAAEAGKTYSPPSGPDPSLFTSNDPEYIVLAEDESAVPAALFEKLDALLTYYSENREHLAADHERRTRLHEARRQWLKQNPPPPDKPPVVNFKRFQTRPLSLA